MKLDEFITTVLSDIETGLNKAEKLTGKDYYIDLGNERGVRFDIAVTTADASGLTAEGNASAGIVRVLGASVGATVEEKSESSQVSRIQFLVFVPKDTKVVEEDKLRRRQQVNSQTNVAWN